MVFITRAKDQESAQRLLDYWADDISERGYAASDALPGLPNSRCVTKPASTGDYGWPDTWCGVVQDRHVVNWNGPQGNDVRQRVTAAYMMLTAVEDKDLDQVTENANPNEATPGSEPAAPPQARSTSGPAAGRVACR